MRTDKHSYYLGIAETVLKHSTCMRRKYGAVIVKDDEVISTGYNGVPNGWENQKIKVFQGENNYYEQ